MIELHYVPDGIMPDEAQALGASIEDMTVLLVMDGQVEHFVEEMIEYYKRGAPDGSNANMILPVGQELVITAFRVAVKNKQLVPGDICVIFKGHFLPIDENGRFNHWPDGFCDVFDKLLDQLL